MDCFVAFAPRNDEKYKDTLSRSRGAMRPGFAKSLAKILGPKNRGRRESRVPGAPAAPCATKKHRGRSHRFAGTPGLPCAMVLTVSFVLSPVTGLCCHRRSAEHSTKLDASVGASGPHDFAVRKHAVRPRQCWRSALYVHRIPHPTSVTTAKRPSCEAGWRINKTVSTKRRNEIFFATGLDSNQIEALQQILDLPVGQISWIVRRWTVASRSRCRDARCRSSGAVEMNCR